MEKLKKLIKEIYIPRFLKEKEKEDKTEAKMTSLMIVKGLISMWSHLAYCKKVPVFLKEINFSCVGEIIMKLFENEEEYSEEDIWTIENLFQLVKSYFEKEDFNEYKNEILKICHLGVNMINNKRNEELRSKLMYNLKNAFENIATDEKFLNIKTRIFKAVIGYLTEKRKIIGKDSELEFRFNDFSYIFKFLEEEENKLKEKEGFYENKKIIDFIKDFKKEIEENGIEDCLIEKLHFGNNLYYIRECINTLKITT